jgi:hypothetical protein
MDRDKIVETMARAIDPVAWSDIEPIDHDERKRSLWEANAALSALEAAGLVVVPREPTQEMLTHQNVDVGEKTARKAYSAMISAAIGDKGNDNA